MFEGIIYFRGPRTSWSGKVDEGEVIGRVSSHFKWFTRWLTRSAYAHLDPERCGYLVREGAVTIEHVQARSP